MKKHNSENIYINNHFEYKNSKLGRKKMQRKFKILIIFFIVFVIALVLIFVLAGLDRLDFQKYGLNYNQITANFSDTTVYEAGLHLVGISNLLLEVPKTPITLSFDKIQSFTNDFFPITVGASVTYSLILPETDEFTFLMDFYIDFGDDPNKILKPIIQNQITKTISSYSSTDYTENVNVTATTLQAEIKAEVQAQVATWTNIDLSIILTSVVCEGVSQNTIFLQRRIEGLEAKLQRVKFQIVELTTFMNKVLRHTQLKADRITKAISHKIDSVAPLIRDSTNSEISKILFGNDVLKKELAFGSSELELRPELYMVNGTMY